MDIFCSCLICNRLNCYKIKQSAYIIVFMEQILGDSLQNEA